MARPPAAPSSTTTAGRGRCVAARGAAAAAFSDQTMRVAITGIVLAFALTVIVVGDDESTRNWAFGAVGTILGYWFNDRTGEAHA